MEEHIPLFQIYLNVGAMLISVLVSIIFKLLYNRMNELKQEIKELSDKHNELNATLPAKYTSKDDFLRIVEVLFDKLDRIADKIDQKADKKTNK